MINHTLAAEWVAFATRLRFLSVVCLFAVISSPLAHGQTWQAGLQGTFPAGAGPSVPSIRYRYYLPEGFNSNQEYPLVLALHGSGQRGTDNNHPQTGFPPLIEKVYSDYPAILVIPQIQSGSWSPDNNPFDLTPGLLEFFLDFFPIDENRLYVTGISMGGFGTTTYLEYFNVENPNGLRFAAGAPSAGASVSSDAAEELRNTPIWFTHNIGDPVVDFGFSLEAFNTIAGFSTDRPFMANAPSGSMGGSLAEVGLTRFTAFDVNNHNSWGPTYRSDEFYEWMFSQTLTSLPELTGDFDGDNDVDADDIDFYRGMIGSDATGELAQADFDGDGQITSEDLRIHVETHVQTSNGQSGTFLGDLDLNGTVDVLGDAFTLVGSLGNTVVSYSQGDINLDGAVSVLGDAFVLIGNLGRTNEP
jgi:hypothetical protein